MGGRKPLKKLKNDLVYFGVRGLIGFFRIIPRKAALRTGALLGRLASRIARKEYRLAVEHLTLAFGNEKTPEEIRRIARESFRLMAMNFVDTVRIRAMSHEQIRAVCIPHNMESALAISGEGKGAIFLTSHAGCWEMLAGYLALSGISVVGVARRLYDPRLEEELYRTRVHTRIRVISRGHDTRDIIRSIKEGFFIGVLIDQDTKVKGTFVDFFGQPAHTATGPAYLALRHNIPVVPVFTWRSDDDRHHICCGDLISIEETGDRDKDVVELTRRCSRAIEDFIRLHPEQWVWFHRRWKTRPPEEGEATGGKPVENPLKSGQS